MSVWFSIAAVTNCRKLRGLNTINVYSVLEIRSPTQVSGLKSRCQKDSVPFWMLSRAICSFAFSSFQNLPFFLGSELPSIVNASKGQLGHAPFLPLCHQSFCLHRLYLRTSVVTLGLPE